MYKGSATIPLKPGQLLCLVPLGDIHFDTAECDRERLAGLVRWIQEQESHGALVRLIGVGDYLDFASPSERGHLATGMHETTDAKLDRAHMAELQDFLKVMKPLTGHFLGLLSGHHYYRFRTESGAGVWSQHTSDEFLAQQLAAPYLGNGLAFIRLALPHGCSLDIAAHHGAGSAQTYGARVLKRVRLAEGTPTAHIVMSGHDNAKFAYPRSGLDFDAGQIKRYVIGTGSFQRAYLEGTEAGYAERMGLIPADLGVAIVNIKVEQRAKQWRVDYHVSV